MEASYNTFSNGLPSASMLGFFYKTTLMENENV